jgi:hypothetical protein
MACLSGLGGRAASVSERDNASSDFPFGQMLGFVGSNALPGKDATRYAAVQLALPVWHSMVMGVISRGSRFVSKYTVFSVLRSHDFGKVSRYPGYPTL